MYNPGLYGMHNGSLRDCVAAKAENAVVVRMAASLSKTELVAHLAALPAGGIAGGLDPAYYARLTAKELRILAVACHMHAFNVSTDNYV